MIKFYTLFLDENVLNKLSDFFEGKLNIQNVLATHQFATIFNLKKPSYGFIERCFTVLVDTESFMELHFFRVLKILKSSGLLITSELEVYNAADRWLSFDIEERGKFAKDLLLAARLPLLSDLT